MTLRGTTARRRLAERAERLGCRARRYRIGDLRLGDQIARAPREEFDIDDGEVASELISRARAIRSVSSGLRRKSICRLVVTASNTGPMCAKMISHAELSARAIMVGPDNVPPGRELRVLTDWDITSVSPSSDSIRGASKSGNASLTMPSSSSMERSGVT